MKRLGGAAILSLSLLAGCGEKAPPPPSAPVETPGEALRKDNKEIAERLAKVMAESERNALADRERNEKTRLVGLVENLRQQWFAAVSETQRTGRSDLEPKLKRLRDLRSEAEKIETSSCTVNAKQTLAAHMDGTLDAYTQFARETGDAGAEVKEKLQQAMNLLPALDKQLGECRPN